jgi:hypothetical protein
VRDLVRYAREHGFDEDPPARIDALLMSAARQHAPVAAPRPGPFERVRQWLVGTMLQPAVAGAVALAVIGGAAGVFYLNDKRVSEPTISGEASRPPPAAQQERVEDGRFDLPSPAAPDESPAGATTGTTGTVSDDLKARLHQLEERGREGRHTATSRGGAVGSDDGNVGEPSPDPFGNTRADKEKNPAVDYRPDGRDSTTVVTTERERGGPGGGGSVGTGGAIDGDRGGAVALGGVKSQITVTSDRSPTPPPPPADKVIEESAAERLESPKNVGTSEVTGTGRSTPPPPSKRTQAENLLRQARTAARNKDCATVKTMARRAKQLDAAYYKDTFARDAAVKDCL